jgi:hypothetical protein
LLIFSVSSSNIFLVFFSTFYGIFHSFWKKKHMLPKVFFQALSNLVFYEDFYFWIKYKHQMFFVPCYNFFWKLGHLKPQVLWVTSQLVESSIVFKIVYFDFFSIFFFQIVSFTLFVFIFVQDYFYEVVALGIFNFTIQFNIWDFSFQCFDF